MQIEFNRITQSNLHTVRPAAGEANVIIASELYRAEFEQTFRGYSIKFVRQGEEIYVVNGREHRVRAGEFLLTNPHCRGTGRLSSATPVVGLCIDLRPAVLAEVLAARGPAANDLDLPPDLAVTLASAPFYECRFDAHRTALGRLLRQSADSIGLHTRNDPESLYALAEGYVTAYGEIARQLRAVGAVRPATRHELHRRLERGREFIETSFTRPIAVPDAARAAQLSTCRYYRLFKQVYGISPHQFILQRRLELGRSLLGSGQCTVTEAALRTGFADIFSFSKAYKQRFGISPGHEGKQPYLAGFDKLPDDPEG